MYLRMRHEGEFRALYELEHAGLLRTAFLLCGNNDTAQEVVSEAFARAAARWWRLRSYDRPGAWLRLVVVRLALRARSNAQRERTSSELPDVAHLDRMPADPTIYVALRALTTAQRDCIVLHHLDDLAVDTIADLLDLPAGTVRSHLHRGRARLAELLAESTADSKEGIHDAR